MATTAINERGYAHPEVLVSTEWVAQHADDPNVRIIELNEDPLLYPSRHITGAVQVDWTTDLNDQVRRDYLRKDGFEQLMARIGVTPETLVVFYGDKNNWWATYAFWVFQLFGHTNAKVMDGGRAQWEREGRPMTRDVVDYPPTEYQRAGSRRQPNSRLPRSSAGASAGGQTADRRAQPGGVQRRAAAHARLPQ